MYMFQGAYKGEAEFFSGRTMQRPIWAEDSDVTEVHGSGSMRSETSKASEAVQGWTTLESPPELELEPGDHQKPGSFS
jgi:hypothetical protein